MTTTDEEYRAELARQTKLLHTAASEAIQRVVDALSDPQLNAIIGALASSLSGALAAIEDEQTRQKMRKLVDKEITQQIARTVAEGQAQALKFSAKSSGRLQ